MRRLFAVLALCSYGIIPPVSCCDVLMRYKQSAMASTAPQLATRALRWSAHATHSQLQHARSQAPVPLHSPVCLLLIRRLRCALCALCSMAGPCPVGLGRLRSHARHAAVQSVVATSPLALPPARRAAPALADTPLRLSSSVHPFCCYCHDSSAHQSDVAQRGAALGD